MRRILERLERGPGTMATTELAALAGCSHDFVRKVILAKVIHAERFGRRFAIPIKEAERFLREVGALRE